MLPYALTIFAGAFLLFQVEPLVARLLLPWFGGSAAVWTLCMLFFQVMLLLGYLYAHACVQYLPSQAQRVIHGALLFGSLLALPVALRESWKPTGAEEPAFKILGLLTVTIGLPFFLLSTTGPLLQAWYAARGTAGPSPDPKQPASASPYRLYAVSNLGSMLALLSYPVAVEPNLSLRQQSLGWSGGYMAYVVLCAWMALRLPDSRRSAARPGGVAAALPAEKPGARLFLSWIALAACASTLLLAVTNHLSQDVAAIPFLWILPLALYLLTFILCFAGRRWPWRRWYLAAPIAAICGMVYLLSAPVEQVSVKLAIPVFAGGLFLCCLVCHGQLASLRPHPRYLTAFYLMISVGGALGGLFVGLIAPRIFSGYAELPISLTAAALVVSLVGAPHCEKRRWDPACIVMVGLTVALGFFLLRQEIIDRDDYRVVTRNFYGVLRVSDSGEPTEPDATRALSNGAIIHGEQYLDPKRQMQPTTYYGRDSGIGLAIRARQGRGAETVGVIGLGAGTLASYGRPGDRYRFYDINPLVVRLARQEFSFLRGSRAGVAVVLGDARLSLAREPGQGFDVLAVDAFSGDAIPVHLLTREAFALYFRLLKKDGLVAVHVSNRYLDLKPVVAAAARAFGKVALAVDSDGDDADDTYDASWVLVAMPDALRRSPLLKNAGERLVLRPGLRLWTDDYSSLWPIVQ